MPLRSVSGGSWSCRGRCPPRVQHHVASIPELFPRRPDLNCRRRTPRTGEEPAARSRAAHRLARVPRWRGQGQKPASARLPQTGAGRVLRVQSGTGDAAFSFGVGDPWPGLSVSGGAVRLLARRGPARPPPRPPRSARPAPRTGCFSEEPPRHGRSLILPRTSSIWLRWNRCTTLADGAGRGVAGPPASPSSLTRACSPAGLDRCTAEQLAGDHPVGIVRTCARVNLLSFLGCRARSWMTRYCSRDAIASTRAPTGSW